MTVSDLELMMILYLFYVVYLAKNTNGIFRKYYKNGSIYIEAPCVKGKVHGIIKNYYENGKLKA